MSELRRLTVEFLKVLAEPVRLEILDLLQNSENSASKIKNILDRSQSTISKHLGMLVEHNLIDFEKRDNIKYYRIKNSEVIDLIKNISTIVLNNNRKKLKDFQEADIRDVLSP